MSSVCSPTPNGLTASYSACRRIAARSHSSFYWAFSLLRSDQRRAMTALYAFARLVDDWADDVHSSAMSEAAWHEYIEKLFPIASVPANSTPEPVWPTDASSRLESAKAIQAALGDTVQRFAIRREYLHDLVSRVAGDLRPTFVVRNESELHDYCYGVASTIGLACIRIWGGDELAVKESAVACGLAFQFTNIVRDLKEDARRGRIYIPQTWLDEFSVDSSTWSEGKPTGDWKPAVQRLIEAARVRYDEGWTIRDGLDSSGRRMFSLIWHTYRGLLDKIAGDLDAVWLGRVRLSRVEKCGLYLRHAFTPAYQIRRCKDG